MMGVVHLSGSLRKTGWSCYADGGDKCLHEPAREDCEVQRLLLEHAIPLCFWKNNSFSIDYNSAKSGCLLATE